MRKVKLGHWADSRTGRAHALAPIDRPWGARGQTRTCGLSGLSKGLSRPVRRSAFSLPYLECKRCSICRQIGADQPDHGPDRRVRVGQGLAGVKDDGQLAGARHVACAGEASRFLEWSRNRKVQKRTEAFFRCCCRDFPSLGFDADLGEQFEPGGSWGLSPNGHRVEPARQEHVFSRPEFDQLRAAVCRGAVRSQARALAPIDQEA